MLTENTDPGRFEKAIVERVKLHAFLQSGSNAVAGGTPDESEAEDYKSEHEDSEDDMVDIDCSGADDDDEADSDENSDGDRNDDGYSADRQDEGQEPTPPKKRSRKARTLARRSR